MKFLYYLEKYSGFSAVATLRVSVCIATFIAQLNIFSDVPISSLGTNPNTKILFITGLIVAAIFFSIFALRAHRFLKSSAVAPAILICGQLAQIIVTLTPYNISGFFRITHVTAAYILALSMPAALAAYTLTAKNSLLHNVNRKFMRLELLLFTVGLGWFIFSSNAGAFSEIIVALSFDIWVLILTAKMLNVKFK